MVSTAAQLDAILTSCHDLRVRFLFSVSTAFLFVFASYWYFILPYVLLLFLLDIKPSG